MPRIPYLNNNYYMWFPPLPRDCDLPPTLYSILESIVNYEKSDKTKIKDLASNGRSTIFNFDYPLSDKVTKEEFEPIILNHFLMRRIGFDTVTAFRIGLNVKLNEIMPLYNKMFDIIYSNLSLGNVTTRTGLDNRNITVDNTTNNTTSLETSSDTKTKHSELPQDEIEAIEDSSYMTDYTSSNNLSTSNGTSGTTGNTNTQDNNNYNEEIINSNNLDNLIKIKNEMQNVYTLIFKDLECLFYGLV